MGRFVVLFMMSAIMISTSYAHPPHSNSGASFGIFYNSLDSYGEWINVDRDVYAWRPVNIHEGWRPYTVGRWAWTSDGWYWLSGEPWGWATYHYGRWFYDDFYGWLWIPGNEWSPAWVEWRYGSDCVGWAPLGPYAVFSVSYGIRYSMHWVTPGFWWSFADCRYVGSPDVHRYVYRAENNTRYIGRTRSAGNVRYEGGRIVTRGPERDYVERRGKTRIERLDVVNAGDRQERVVRDGNRDRIEVYRPKIEERERGGDSERPVRVKESGRRVGIDVDDIAVRTHEREAMRGQGRREEYREPVDNNQRKQTERQRETDRSSVQTPSRNDRGAEISKQRNGQRRNEPARVERQTQRETSRSPNPERTIRRSEQRQPDNSAERGGGRRR